MKEPVIIVGGGWSGLSAAISLLENKIPVTLLEAAPELGGRARAIPFKGQTVDNGQHLFLGGYRGLKQILAKLNIDPEQCFIRKPLTLLIKSASKQSVHLQFKKIPSPFHALWGLMNTKGITFTDKIRALNLSKDCYQQYIAKNDISVKTLLQHTDQSQHLTRFLWDPLCLASLSTPSHLASSEIFLNVLNEIFKRPTSNSDFMFASKDLSTIFPNPAKQAIHKLGGHIHTHKRAKRLLVENNQCIGVQTQHETFFSKQVILAIPPDQALTLLNDHAELLPLTSSLTNFTYETITTIYCQYPETVRLGKEMIGLVGTLSQWVFDRQFVKQPGLMAVVITGNGPHHKMDNHTLIEVIAQELHEHFDSIPPLPIASRVIREKRGAFSSHVGINAYRPQNKTLLPGLFLAGDYTQTGYPASIESAVQSGLTCAHLVNNEVK